MRPSRQKEIITSHVHGLENVNIKLEVLKDSVTRVKKRAILWLEEKDEASYLQIKQYLLERNSRFLQACIDIASDNDVTEESLREEWEEMTSSSQPKVQGHKTNSMDLSQQRKHIQEISQKQVDVETKYESNSDQCLKELDQASDFIKLQTKSLSQKLNQCEERNETILKKQTEIEDHLKTEIDTLTKQMQSFTDLTTTKTDTIFGNINTREKQLMAIFKTNKEKEEKMELLLKAQEDLKKANNQTSENTLTEIERAKTEIECLRSEYKTLIIIVNELERNLKDSPNNFQKHVEEMDTILSSNTSEIKTLHKSVTDISKSLTQIKSFHDTTFPDFQAQFSTIYSAIRSWSKLSSAKIESEMKDLNVKILGFSKDIASFRDSNETEAFCLEVANMKETDIKKDTILTLFNYAGNVTLSPHYNMSTSTYTVPHDGIYLCCLMVENLTDMKVQFHVYYKDKSGKESPRVYSQAYHKDLTSCSVIPIYMYKGDQMYIKSALDYPLLKLGNNSFFSCVLLKKF
ncbi:transmembrane and coiled-coil domain-containing protein 5B [Biomphalaria glabrata]|nr:transmembrane and coiled-coil domain-containing protein 5B [Biomphalaria glabrata]